MFVNDVKYRGYIKQICDTFSPLNWLLKILSLNCTLDGNNHRPYFTILKSVITTIILGGINIFTLYYKITSYYKTLIVSVKYTDAVQMVYDLFQYVVDLYFVYKYGSNIFFEYINQYAFIDGRLGMVYYSNIKRRLIKIMIFISLMWITSSAYDYVIWAIGFGIINTTIFAIAYIYLFIKILTNLDLTLNVMHIESRLRVMGDLIQNSCCTSVTCSARVEDTVAKKNWFYYKHQTSDYLGKMVPLANFSCLDWNDVKCLSRCYLLLTEQVNYINNMFGLRILLNCLSLLIDLVRFTNLAVRVLMGSQYTGYDNGYYAVISTLWRSLTCVVVIVSLVCQCERTYRQRERIISLIDHLTLEKILDEKLATAYNELRSLVQSRPINFHMAHFMRLDYPLLASITSVFVTYTIILLQSI